LFEHVPRLFTPCSPAVKKTRSTSCRESNPPARLFAPFHGYLTSFVPYSMDVLNFAAAAPERRFARREGGWEDLGARIQGGVFPTGFKATWITARRSRKQPECARPRAQKRREPGGVGAIPSVQTCVLAAAGPPSRRSGALARREGGTAALRKISWQLANHFDRRSAGARPLQCGGRNFSVLL
jgi:hypothetical protein